MARPREVLREDLQQRVTSGLHLGRLRPGERLRSARQTAREQGADYRMVVTALRGLERDGLVEIRPRGGIYVGGRSARPRVEQLEGFAQRLAGFVVDELADGLAVADVAERLRSCLSTAGLRAACIECNQDQLDFLCEELQLGFGLQGTPVEVDRLRVGPPPAVLAADVLVSTSFHAGVVRRCAAKLGKASVIATLDPRQRAEVTRLLAERPVCFLGVDPRWATKVRRIWADEPGAERLGALTVGHDPLELIPEDAVILMMPRARRLLAGTPLAERGKPLPHRGLSLQTTREILAFLVNANLGLAPAGRR